MRILQNILLLIGTTALGCALGALALYLGISGLVTKPKGENFGGAQLWIGLILCGGMLGAFSGFGYAVHWIARHESRTWSSFVWIGVALGLVIGLLASFSFSDLRLEFWFWLVCIVFILPVFSAAGGMLANLAVVIFKRKSRR